MGDVVLRQAELHLAEVLQYVQQIVGEPAEGEDRHHQHQHLDRLPLGADGGGGLLGGDALAEELPPGDGDADEEVAEGDHQQGQEKLGGEGEAGERALVEPLRVLRVDGLAAVQHLDRQLWPLLIITLITSVTPVTPVTPIISFFSHGHHLHLQPIEHLNLHDDVEDGVGRGEEEGGGPHQADEDPFWEAVAEPGLQRLHQRLVPVDGRQRHRQH